jgi:hypothetical protein
MLGVSANGPLAVFDNSLQYAAVISKRFLSLFCCLIALSCKPIEENRQADVVTTIELNAEPPAGTEDRQQADQMRVIEQNIELPAGSEALDRYARVYKSGRSNHIEAVFFIPSENTLDGSCRSSKSYGPSNGQILMLCPPPDGMTAGESRWLSDGVHLPDKSDGGCSLIQIEYSIALNEVISAICNGVA